MRPRSRGVPAMSRMGNMVSCRVAGWNGLALVRWVRRESLGGCTAEPRQIRARCRIVRSFGDSSMAGDAVREGWQLGMREAFATPAWVLGVGYIGYGSLAQSQGFSAFNTALSTLSIWALPGQLI